MAGKGEGERPAVPPSALLETRADVLTEVTAQAGSLLDPEAVAHASAVAARIRERTALSAHHVVVALAGSTGAGKSSLFNALVGETVAEVGVRRPMTSIPRAAIWGGDPGTALLDWLDVAGRHRVANGDAALDGLVLLDLPDFDSRVEAHRAEADRILALVDLFVWVTDPQKYADAVMHDQYIAAHTRHEANTVVVLNQADRLTPEARAQCIADLTRLLEADGLTRPQVIATSATTGMGVDELRARMAGAVADRQSSLRRLDADARDAAARLRAGVGDREAVIDEATRERLVSALARAAGVPAALAAVQRSYLRDAARHTGLVFTRWRRLIGADPLTRLRLGQQVTDEASQARAELQRSSMPEPTPAAKAEMDLAVRGLSESATTGLPPRWAQAVEDAAHPGEADLRDALDRAVSRTVVRHRTPLWWRAVGVVQWLVALIVVAGVLWYAALALAGWLQFVLPDVPRWGPAPYPFLMIVGGLVVGLLLAGVSRAVAGPASQRRRRAVERALRAAIAEAADGSVIAPVEQVLGRHREIRTRLDTAAGAPSR